MPLAAVNGQKIHYTDFGDGPAIIATHTVMMDSVSLDPLTTRLVGYRVVSFDQRGHGKTVGDDQPFQYGKDLAADAFRLADYLGIEEFIFLADGIGSAVALTAALDAPERVRALVLFDPNGEAPPKGEIQALEASADMLKVAGPMEQMFLRIAKFATGTPEAADDLMARWKQANWSSFRVAVDALTSRPSLIEKLPAITCPVLIFHAAHDVYAPIFLGKAIEKNLGGPVKFVRIEHPKHALTYLFIDGLSDQVLAWLNDVG